MSEVNYNDGKWHGWNGGECPVHPKTLVQVVFSGQSAHKFYGHVADNLEWQNGVAPSNIIVFRVTEPYVEPKKPREFWIGNDTFLGLPDIKTVETKGYIHVREVL